MTTIYFRDPAEADWFALRVGGDVTVVQGHSPYAVTFSVEAL